MYLINIVKDKGKALWLESAKLKLTTACELVITVLVNWWISNCSRQLSQRDYGIKDGRSMV